MSDTRPKSSEVDPRLLEVLVCPATHTPLEYDRAAGELISRAARLAYPIRAPAGRRRIAAPGRHNRANLRP